MNEPHTISIDCYDLRDLIDDRERLETALRECTREAMNSADQWRALLDKATAAAQGFDQFRRAVQEALDYDQPDLISGDDLVKDIRSLVEHRMAPSPVPTVRSLAAPDVWQEAAQAIDNFPGWSHDPSIDPPAAPRVPAHAVPRIWSGTDPEPPTAGPTAVWGVLTELGDLYRPKADEELGWVWARADGTWWRWEIMLTDGPVTEAFPPSPEPREDTAAEDTPTAEALAEPVDSDSTTDTSEEPAW